jgi:hypothetical protein
LRQAYDLAETFKINQFHLYYKYLRENSRKEKFETLQDQT